MTDVAVYNHPVFLMIVFCLFLWYVFSFSVLIIFKLLSLEIIFLNYRVSLVDIGSHVNWI